MPRPCKQSTSPAMELLQFSWSVVWECFGAAFSKHNSFLSSYKSGLRKDCNNTMMRMLWTMLGMRERGCNSSQVSKPLSRTQQWQLTSHCIILIQDAFLLSSERHKLVFYSSAASVTRERRFQNKVDSDFRKILRHKYFKQCISTLYTS